MGRHHNRVRKEVLSEKQLHRPSKRELNRIEKARTKAYTELSERVQRDSQLKTWMRDMEMQAQVMGKGKKKKVKNAKKGRPAQYKWAPARKK